MGRCLSNVGGDGDTLLVDIVIVLYSEDPS